MFPRGGGSLVRVISGRWGGRILPARIPSETRPTLDAVREALFNMLACRMSFDGQSVLDLYAGSGALGIEALSRGAAHATFVDRSKRAAQAIDENCRALAIPPSLYTIVCEDAKRFLEQCGERFTLMFADPPYQGVAEWKRLIPALLHAACIERGAVCVFEYSAALKLELPQPFQTITERQWGDTTCLIACRQ